MTSEEDPELEKKAMAEGAVGFICKTTEPAILLRCLLQTVVALAAAQIVPRVLETWQRLLPNPYPANRQDRAAQPRSTTLETWQKLLPGPCSCDRPASFFRSRLPKPAA